MLSPRTAPAIPLLEFRAECLRVNAHAQRAPAVSKHLKVLERAGLIARGREAQRRPCRITPDALKDVDAWLESYRALWDERLDRLEVYLREVQEKQKKGKRHGRHGR